MNISHIVKVGILLVLCAICTLFIRVYFQCRAQCVLLNDRYVKVAEQLRRELCERYSMHKYHQTFIDRCALTEICNGIEVSLSNGNVAVTKEFGEILNNTGINGMAGLDAKIFERKLYTEFLWSEEMHGFEVLEDFSDYIRINMNLALYFGCMKMKQNEYDSLPAIEYLMYKKIKDYSEKFQKENRREFIERALALRDLWVNQIESEDGFTRNCARRDYFMNTDFAESMCLGKGLPKERALKHSRALANGLIKLGYIPKWIDEISK